jgi:hypothetical protein
VPRVVDLDLAIAQAIDEDRSWESMPLGGTPGIMWWSCMGVHGGVGWED